MVQFNSIVQKFEKKGEKTGWTYIFIPNKIANKLKAKTKKSFYVKGMLDSFPISRIALLPMGKGDFILPLNSALRKGVRKREGDTLSVKLQLDSSEFVIDQDFIVCLQDEPNAYAFFKTLSGSHQRYFSKWIDSAKTEATKAKRITQAVIALGNEQGYAEMLRAGRKS